MTVIIITAKPWAGLHGVNSFTKPSLLQGVTCAQGDIHALGVTCAQGVIHTLGVTCAQDDIHTQGVTCAQGVICDGAIHAQGVTCEQGVIHAQGVTCAGASKAWNLLDPGRVAQSKV